jgi:hypothetical protein
VLDREAIGSPPVHSPGRDLTSGTRKNRPAVETSGLRSIRRGPRVICLVAFALLGRLAAFNEAKAQMNLFNLSAKVLFSANRQKDLHECDAVHLHFPGAPL